MDLVTTGDGSKTLYNATVGECYHSKHGAVQESKHVFVNMGLDYFLNQYERKQVSILEIGFGTGLNFIQTCSYISSTDIQLSYLGIEGFPLSLDIVQEMGYGEYVSTVLWQQFLDNYSASFTEPTKVTAQIDLHIAQTLLLEFKTDRQFDVVYFDAFAAVHQPEMWSDESLSHITQFIKPGGVFVTYAITGNLKRSMKALGFKIEKAPGAPGKREMLRAIKL